MIIKTLPYSPINRNLPWDLVGVYGYDGLTEKFEKVYLKDVYGKIVICEKILITAPRNILADK